MNSPLIAALGQTLRSNAPKTLYGSTNMLGEVLAYGEKTIKVKALNGMMAGEVMDIELPARSKAKMTDFTKPSKAQTSMYTETGGILRFDGVVKKKGGEGYECGWINTWIKTPSETNKVVADAQTTLINTGRQTSSGYPNMRMNALEAQRERKVGSLDELQEAMADAFSTHRAALIIDINDGTFSSIPAYLTGSKVDGAYVFPDPKVHAENVIAKLTDEQRAVFASALEVRGMTVVPMASLPIGGKTAEEIEGKMKIAAETGKPARIMSVNPLAYEGSSIGLRLQNALTRTDREGKLVIAKELGDRLGEAFLSTAAEDAKAAYHKDGFPGVADVDLKSFFKANGIEMKDHPGTSWNRAAIHQQQFEGGKDFFVAKTHEMARYGNPYPALECTKDLRSAYANELVNAVTAFFEAPAVQKAADVAKEEVKSEAPAGDVPAPAAGDTTAAALQTISTQEQDIDDMLMDVLGEDKPGI